ncbi:gephyrin-like molybdotransferase Glp [Alkalicoccus urumqiensis]|uniref:Molybdopterin molybdenumtransferase n=1 Tax=Alkalicoccus urumqiensis TaxID=1548213 RepID=A0A2P6MD75_ALKUR|nr:gephyrin-like molybdotransferase Glp [Alkalicoccus urumqiensis]PRO64220.1 molybdopterin molybdenumtransferase [Alkalicoccus urumqiensis]
MLEKRKPLQVRDAQRMMLEHAASLHTEWLPLEKAAGRVLAEDVTADAAVPPFDRSPYDGYAVRAEDTKGAGRDTPVHLQILETIGAGSVPDKEVTPGTASRIMTGAMIPSGADAVIMLEQTSNDTSGEMAVYRECAAGENIVRKASEMAEGEVVVTKGTTVHPGVTAVLAAFGHSRVLVRRRPRIGVIATGTELLEPHEALETGKIRNSNAYMVLHQLAEAGAETVYLGKLDDDLPSAVRSTGDALESVDALITTGGVSVGDFDFLPEVYKQLGADVLFNKIAMRPGSVTSAAVIGKKVLFGLSGNPSACFVGFELFAGPWIRASQGDEAPYLQKGRAVLGEDFSKPNPFTRFIRGTFHDSGSTVCVPAGMDKSQAVTTLAHTSILIVLPGGTRGYQKGDEVDILYLHSSGSQEPLHPEKRAGS